MYTFFLLSILAECLFGTFLHPASVPCRSDCQHYLQNRPFDYAVASPFFEILPKHPTHLEMYLDRSLEGEREGSSSCTFSFLFRCKSFPPLMQIGRWRFRGFVERPGFGVPQPHPNSKLSLFILHAVHVLTHPSFQMLLLVPSITATVMRQDGSAVVSLCAVKISFSCSSRSLNLRWQADTSGRPR